MMSDPNDFDTRPAGLAMTASAGVGLFLMLHHPTSFDGDDGHLLADMANGVVHGGMIAVLLALAVGVDALTRRLGPVTASTAAGRILFTTGVGAEIGAGLVNGFVMERVLAATASGEGQTAAMTSLWMLNQALATMGIVGIGLGAGLLAVRMVRAGRMMRVAAAVGVAMAIGAPAWAVVGGGTLELVPAVVSMVMVSIWSVLVGAFLIGRDKRGTPA
jgi:hypothetical protein